MKPIRYFSMFSGIGGFELGIEQAAKDHELKAECVGYSEIDKHAIKTYEEHFSHDNYGDATTINADALPEFDLLAGCFPCQAFCIAGKRLGFEETRGTLFSTSPESSEPNSHDTSSSKTSKGSSATTAGKLSEPSSGPLMGWGMTSSGRYSTARITAYPSPENACTLSEILEEHPDPKYFLPPDRVTRIQQSASQQKPQLLAHSRPAETPAETTAG